MSIKFVGRVVCAVVGLAIYGCGIFDDEGQKKVKYALRDASSAEFRNSKKADKTPGTDENVFCGEVNSKNSYGALVGFKKYVVDGRAVLFEGDDDGAVYDASSFGDADAVTSAGITVGKLTLSNYKVAAMIENQKKRNKDKLEGISVEGGSYNRITAFNVAWDKHCN